MRLFSCLAVLLCGAALGAQHRDLQQTARALFGVLEPVPADVLARPDVMLGRQLYWDERLSADGRTSCASCHAAADWGADARPFSRDARGALTSRHSPTVFNAIGQVALRWLGDRADGASQAERSITGSMGLSSTDALVPLLEAHGYPELFRAAFPDDPTPVTSANYGRAIEAYIATLVTPAPFDAFLAGDVAALREDQQDGLRLFVSAGCAGCHNGPRLGGSSFHKFGLVRDYWEETGSARVDEGRFAITGEEADRYVFRTPMLRNIARTAPYFHDGSVATLDEAVRIMATVQSGRSLSEVEIRQLVAFLESLTGEIPPHYSAPRSGSRD